MNFEPCYPVESQLFLKLRFMNELKNFIPIKIKDIGTSETWSFEELFNIIKNKSVVVNYRFQIKDSILTEFINIELNNLPYGRHFELTTPLQTEESQSLYITTMLKLFGVVLFGTLKSDEEFIARDSVCTTLARHLINDNYNINWSEGFPYINYFFMTKFFNEPILPLGAGLIDSHTASFYMMKGIDKWDNSAVITEEVFNSFQLITPEESKMANILANVVSTIDSNAEINFVKKALSVFQENFGEEYYKQGSYFLDVNYEAPDVSTYKGISVLKINEKKKVVINSGDFFYDLQTIYNSFDDELVNLSLSSSIDHFQMDINVD